MKSKKGVEILTNKDFLLVWGAQVISMLGNWTYYVAIAAVLYDMTQSGRGIAILRSLQTGALLVIAPIAGIIVDRFHRKRIMVFSDLSRAAVLLVLLVAPPESLIIYLVGIALTVLSVLFGSAETAILPDIVDKEDLVTANSLTSTTQNLMLIAGGAVGGTIVASGGYRLAFLLDILTFVLSAALLSFVRGKSAIICELKEATLPVASLWERVQKVLGGIVNDVIYCFKYLRNQSEVVMLIAMVSLLSFGAGFVNVVTIVYANQVLGVGSEGYGYLLTIQGIGSLLGALCMVLFNRWFSKRTLFNGGFLMMGTTMALLGVTERFIVAGTLFFLSGFGNVLFLVASTSVMQERIAPDVRGRVFSLHRDRCSRCSSSGYDVYWTGRKAR